MQEEGEARRDSAEETDQKMKDERRRGPKEGRQLTHRMIELQE